MHLQSRMFTQKPCTLPGKVHNQTPGPALILSDLILCRDVVVFIIFSKTGQNYLDRQGAAKRRAASIVMLGEQQAA